MTVLDDYARLEATAVWRAEPSGQRRDVFVSLGEATLIIHDGREVALAHWSLPAVTRLNPGERPARFGPGADSDEELEIVDDTMVEAIDRVRRAVERTRPHPGRLRFSLVAGVMIAVLLLAVFWVPGALVRQTAMLVPPASRAAIGEALVAELRPMTGPACRTPAGDLALARLKNRLVPDSDHRIAVMPAGVTYSAHLPGGLILVGRAAVEDHEWPDAVAGHVLAEAAAFAAKDPLETILSEAGPGATLRLLTSGALPEGVLRAHARAIIARAEPTALDDAAPGLFAAAGVSPAAYVAAVGLADAGAVVAGATRPILEDGDWVALQNICGS